METAKYILILLQSISVPNQATKVHLKRSFNWIPFKGTGSHISLSLTRNQTRIRKALESIYYNTKRTKQRDIYKQIFVGGSVGRSNCSFELHFPSGTISQTTPRESLILIFDHTNTYIYIFSTVIKKS